MISNRTCTAWLLFAAFVFVSSPAAAQYMYLDANGNGVHDSGDRLAPNGTPTTVDVWLVTDHNRDGSPATCDVEPGAPLAFNSYFFNLQAAAGSVSYGGFVTYVGPVAFGELNPGDGVRYANGFGGFITYPPGTYHLATLTITGTGGIPFVNIVDQVSGEPNFTSFGTGASSCFGNDFDNTYKLTGPAGGSDWTDVDGLGPFLEPGPPVLQQPANMTVDEGMVAMQTILAFDPDNAPLTFTKVSGPFWMTVTTLTPTSGRITLAPDFASAGSYTGTVRASNGTLSDQKSFQIMVNNVCQGPTASAGGPYTGTTDTAVHFDGSGSSDPDGDALSYAWTFGDGASGTGPTPSHTYAAGGSYSVTLRVTDPCNLSDDDATTVTIAACLDAYAFTTSGNKQTNLNSGKQATCVQIQPFNGSFTIGIVDLSSIVMRSPGTGAVDEIHAQGVKTAVVGDRNGDGVDEISACFRKEDLQQLFSGLSGTQSVAVSLEGNVLGGGHFCTGLTLNVKAGGGGNLAANISPNPLNPSAVLTFHTERRGPLLVQLFDVRGRLLRTLRDESDAAAGYHDVRIDGTDASGARLGSGVYYVRIRAGAEEERKAITILK